MGVQQTEKTYKLDEVRLLSPIIPRSKVIGVARNWSNHASELGNEAPTSPQYFIKPNTSVVGPGDPISLPEWSEEVSFEGELAVVIGRIAKSVPVERVDEIIFGYTVANDLTARDAQRTDLQWTRAKGFDGACPLGPWIQTELDTDDLEIKTWVDGDLKQDGTTSDMIFSVAELVAAISEGFTLLPGDVILTGTPAGVGLLKPGNEVEIEVEGIGALVNTIRG
ncbi:2-hydroxyhepta-2,4-diene-1,7-dioate isomerase [Mycobacteroides abscessus subsp. abscessus]|nr:2-hydroxyhepta-2,4-diene-1,7-dioate isomerase [Mycobacteroides abscessus subsp. abscessus]